MAQTRGLSECFLNDLKQSGRLNPLLARVQQDTSLDMEIRENYLNVYYRGGSLLKVAHQPRKPGRYVFSFDTKYASEPKRGKLGLPCPAVESAIEAQAWVDACPILKDTMDLWFGRNPKDERALQQMVTWENNDSPWAAGTDWFVVDIEYDNHRDARFDLVGLQWNSAASARKLKKGYLPRLAIIEMKAGDGALSGTAGIDAHLRQLREFLSDSRRVQEFKREMLTVLHQKRELDLIKALRSNRNNVDALDAEIDLIFLLAGHDPASRKLGDILEAIQRSGAADISGASVSLCAANFMGFGLYRENVQTLPEFVRHHGEQIGG